MYIKREAALELIKNFGKGAVSDGRKTLDPVDDIIILAKGVDFIPAADVVEVRHGKWITDEKGVVICSECGEEHEWQEFRPPYCDMCGAKMDGKDGTTK